MIALAAGCGSSGDAQLPVGGDGVAGSNARLESVVGQAREVARLYDLAASAEAAACMREAGFEYWEPAVPASGLSPDPGVNDVEAEPERASGSDVGEDGSTRASSGALISPEEEAGQQDADPSGRATLQSRNDAYVQSLSPDAKRAYGIALLGREGDAPMIQVEDANGEVVVEYLSGGCLGQARDAVLSRGVFVRIESYLHQLEMLTFEVNERMRGSSQYQTLTERLSSCVAAEGIEVEDIQAEVEAVAGLDLDEREVVADCVRELNVDPRIVEMRDAAASVVLTENDEVIGSWQQEHRSFLQPLRERMGIAE